MALVFKDFAGKEDKIALYYYLSISILVRILTFVYFGFVISILYQHRDPDGPELGGDDALTAAAGAAFAAAVWLIASRVMKPCLRKVLRDEPQGTTLELTKGQVKIVKGMRSLIITSIKSPSIEKKSEGILFRARRVAFLLPNRILTEDTIEKIKEMFP
jgi:hypothetical protein